MKIISPADACTTLSRLTSFLDELKVYEGEYTKDIPAIMGDKFKEYCVELFESYRATYGDDWARSGDCLLMERVYTHSLYAGNYFVPEEVENFNQTIVDVTMLLKELQSDCATLVIS